jgi:uncharacterized protein CbrC (UPF0167 family)
MSTLPTFRYHPDPVQTGSIVERPVNCVCCGKRRDYTYIGPVYAAADLDGHLCPWCVASGAVHEEFGATFTDEDALVDSLNRTRTRNRTDVINEVSGRTPGFSGWQQERWLVHCGDACAFLGPAGQTEVASYSSADLLESLRTDAEMTNDAFERYLAELDKDRGPTAYVFRCLHCSRLLGYSDSA